MKLQSFFSILAIGLPLVARAARNITHDEIETNAAQGLRLLTLSDDADPVWKTEEEKLTIVYFDVTYVYEAQWNWTSTKSLATLTTSSDWVLNRAKTIATGRADITVTQFKHNFAQSTSSVITRIAGSASGPVTIVGAHLDSINMANPVNGRAPGADDDGTGTVNLIEAFRALVAAGFKPSTPGPLEFHWYAAEEVGLLGSHDIATSYKNTGVQVKAMVQFDMTGYFKPSTPEVISLITDNIDAGLNAFLKLVIAAYNTIPADPSDDPCGYACSDHASWNSVGYPAAFPFEANFVAENYNPNIHTDHDTTGVAGFSWTHSLEFVKLAVAAAYELSA
ncbi:hypothetical protein VNI00_012700 [Paramarasmius palmivorus]|uniref:Peptide hydrolase n=1 Tax=Paramarasmius palmivorus TaxID=297713 RepID=A0AAW0C3B0_9AGAR